MTRISHEMAKSELQPTIYTGTFIHTLPSSSSSSSTSTPIATLSVLENAAVFVDRNGIIVRICPNIIESSSQSKGNDGVSAALSKRIMQELQTLSTTTGYGWSLNNWVDAEERSGNGLRGKGGRWWFPGFVGECYFLLSIPSFLFSVFVNLSVTLFLCYKTARLHLLEISSWLEGRVREVSTNS